MHVLVRGVFVWFIRVMHSFSCIRWRAQHGSSCAPRVSQFTLAIQTQSVSVYLDTTRIVSFTADGTHYVALAGGTSAQAGPVTSYVLRLDPVSTLVASFPYQFSLHQVRTAARTPCASICADVRTYECVVAHLCVYPQNPLVPASVGTTSVNDLGVFTLGNKLYLAIQCNEAKALVVQVCARSYGGRGGG